MYALAGHTDGLTGGGRRGLIEQMARVRALVLGTAVVALSCKDPNDGGFDFESQGTDSGTSGATEASGSTVGATDSAGTDATDPTAASNASASASNGGNKFDVGTLPDPTPSGEGCSRVDFLFVIDTSGSMGQEQEALRLAYPGFIQGIEASGIADYHVAVTTADMGYCPSSAGDMGEFQWQPAIDDPGCYPLPHRYISGPSGDSTAEFQCIAEIFGGSGIEQSLQGGYSALIDRIQDGTNPVEFRRPDALLVVMYITDEDDQSYLQGGLDCTIEPVSVYTQLYEQAVLKGNPTAGVFIAISGPPTTSCSSVGLGSASAAPRINEFVTYWGQRGFWANICDGDFPAALEGALDTIEFGCDEFDPEG
jgi:hypothetical protein